MEHATPFDRFLKTPELAMLEAALPYVSDSMRKPLAVYMKSAEIRRILSHFDQEDLLSACGFEQNSPDPEAMLNAMKMAGGKNAAPQIDQALQMINMLKTYRKLNDLMENNPEMMSFLTRILNQSGAGERSFETPVPPASGTESSDMMKLLTQMLKNSR